MRAPAVLAVATAALLAAAALVWYVVQDTPPLPPEPADAPPDAPPAKGRPAKEPVAPLAANGIEGPAVDDKAPPPKPHPTWPGKEPPIPEPSAEQHPGAGAHFMFPGWEETIGKVDWTHVGIASRHARVTFRDVCRKFEHGAELSAVLHPTFMASHAVSQLVAPMVDKGMNLTPGQPMRPPSGLPFTHPAFESNAIAATLDQWGRPLTKEQEAAVKSLFDARFEEWRQSETEGGASPWHFEGFVSLTRSRAELQTRLEEILDDAQRAALWTPDAKGRAGLDLFSLSTLWKDQIMVLPVGEDEDPAEMLSGRLRGEMSISRKVGPEFDAAVAAWVKGQSPEWKKGLRGPASRFGFVTEAELLAGLEAMAEFVRTVDAKGWRDPNVDPMLPPFRKLFLFSRVRR